MATADCIDPSKGSTGVEGDTQEEALLKGQVLVSKKVYNLQLTSSHLMLVRDESTPQSILFKGIALNLPWREVVGALEERDGLNIKDTSFFLYYMFRKCDKLKEKVIQITCEGITSQQWVECIQKQCAAVPGRPKKLWTLVNPIGGSKKGEEVYEKLVLPLLERAQITPMMKVTEHSKHATELACMWNFSNYDGILLVGGDGLYQETVQGLVKQMQRTAEADMDDADAPLKPPDIPIGIVPAGTGNGVAMWLNGVIDVETAVLNVIRGEQHRGMIYTVYSGGKFLAVSALLFGYGFWNEMIQRTDELRWMGRARYPYCLLGSLLKQKRSINCEVEILQAEKASSSVDANGFNEQDKSPKPEPKWTCVSENKEVASVFGFAVDRIRCGDHYKPNYFGDSTCFTVDFGAGKVGLMKAAYSLGSNHKTLPTVSNLGVYEHVIGFRVKGLQESRDGATSREKMLERIVNLDGEPLSFEGSDLEARLHPHYLPVYGRFPCKNADT